MSNKILIYGANGYTGQLIVEEALRQNLSFDIGGRNEESLKKMATQHKIDYKVFGLSDINVIVEHIQTYKAVIHSAGPFIHTAKNMMKACLQTKVHYMDITGEIPVFELGASMDQKAKDAGIVIMPGCGFDVVPTDCMAAYLKSELPSATHLQLGFASYGGRVSHGTALTMVENLGRSGAVRKDGKIVPVPTAYKGQIIPFRADKGRFAMTIPWGDVSTSYYSTAIPNIETYMSVSEKSYKRTQFLNTYFRWLMKKEFVKNILRKRIKKMPAGPNEQERQESYMMVWGKVWDANGKMAEARVKTPEGYKLTAMCAVAICQKVIGQDKMTGFFTPSLAFGHNLLNDVTGAVFENIHS
jgi:short subunit dehydrogenase-like uncharacterized protein